MSSSELFPISPKNLPTIHTSVMLRRLIDNAPVDHFSLDWLISSMPERSYGVVILFLAFLTFVPIIDFFTRLLIMFFALQIICGYRNPILPKRVMLRKMPSRYLTELPQFAFHALMRVERSIRPRWGMYLGTRRLSACILFLVSFVSLIVPLPFANVPSAIITALIALAYLEHDGFLLVIAQAIGIVMLGLTFMAFVTAL